MCFLRLKNDLNGLLKNPVKVLLSISVVEAQSSHVSVTLTKRDFSISSRKG